jgi:Domain of unknown function (DUF4160)
MPVILRVGSYQFQFFASDHDEPPHIHVRNGRKKVKFWLTPVIRMAKNQRFKPHELTLIRSIIQEQRAYFLEKWHEEFPAV